MPRIKIVLPARDLNKVRRIIVNSIQAQTKKATKRKRSRSKTRVPKIITRRSRYG